VLICTEKRKLEESVIAPEEVKKAKVDGDVPSDLISEIVATVTDPEDMVGPDVRGVQITCHDIKSAILKLPFRSK